MVRLTIHDFREGTPVLIGKDYLSVLPATIQVGNFPGIFKLNIATNLVWSASTEEDWIELPKTEGGKEILSVGYTANVDVTTSRKAKITFSAEGVDDVVVDIVQSDKTFTNPIAGIPDPWIVQYQGLIIHAKRMVTE